MTNLTFNNLEANTSLFYSLLSSSLNGFFLILGHIFWKILLFGQDELGFIWFSPYVLENLPVRTCFVGKVVFLGKRMIPQCFSFATRKVHYVCKDGNWVGLISIYLSPIHFNMFDFDLIEDLSGNKMNFVFKFGNRLGQKLGFFHC